MLAEIDYRLDKLSLKDIVIQKMLENGVRKCDLTFRRGMNFNNAPSNNSHKRQVSKVMKTLKTV